MRVSKLSTSVRMRRRWENLQLGLDTNGLASGINIGGGERSGGEVAVAVAHGVGGGSAGDEEAGEDSDGLGDGRHCDVGCCECVCGVGVDCGCGRERGEIR